LICKGDGCVGKFEVFIIKRAFDVDRQGQLVESDPAKGIDEGFV